MQAWVNRQANRKHDATSSGYHCHRSCVKMLPKVLTAYICYAWLKELTVLLFRHNATRISAHTHINCCIHTHTHTILILCHFHHQALRGFLWKAHQADTSPASALFFMFVQTQSPLHMIIGVCKQLSIFEIHMCHWFISVCVSFPPRGCLCLHVCVVGGSSSEGCRGMHH